METERLQSSIERYKSKIHHMEFKTTELEATLSRKEQIITKLQQDLEEVTDTYLFKFIHNILFIIIINTDGCLSWISAPTWSTRWWTFVQKKRPLIQPF